MIIRVKNKELVKTRIVQGLSQRGLARKAKISSAFMSQIERGERNPSPAIAKQICDVLGVGFDHIFFIENACNSEHVNVSLCAH